MGKKSEFQPSSLYPIIICGIIIVLVGIFLTVSNQMADGSGLRLGGKNGSPGAITGPFVIGIGLLFCMGAAYFLSRSKK